MARRTKVALRTTASKEYAPLSSRKRFTGSQFRSFTIILAFVMEFGIDQERCVAWM